MPHSRSGGLTLHLEKVRSSGSWRDPAELDVLSQPVRPGEDEGRELAYIQSRSQECCGDGTLASQ